MLVGVAPITSVPALTSELFTVVAESVDPKFDALMVSTNKTKKSRKDPVEKWLKSTFYIVIM